MVSEGFASTVTIFPSDAYLTAWSTALLHSNMSALLDPPCSRTWQNEVLPIWKAKHPCGMPTADQGSPQLVCAVSGQNLGRVTGQDLAFQKLHVSHSDKAGNA